MFPSFQNKIDNIFLDFQQFENNVTAIEDFCEWCNNVDEFYFNFNLFERLKYKSLDPLYALICCNSHIQKLIKSHSLAVQGMIEFDAIDKLNEVELIGWVLKYEDNELSYGDYTKVDNWKRNNLILHSWNSSVVIDCSNYSESLMFSETQPKYYYKLYEKYKITKEEFEIAKNVHGIKFFDLRTFLKVHKLIGI